MKVTEFISWLAHRLAMAFACITIGAVLAYLSLENQIIQVTDENALYRQLIQHCEPEKAREGTLL